MNCKPGDLAVIVRCTLNVNVGKLVRVARLYGPAIFRSGATFGNCWLVEGRRLQFRSGAPVDPAAQLLGADAVVPDEWLRPIRDPGDDARDETLDWLPVPHKEMA